MEIDAKTEIHQAKSVIANLVDLFSQYYMDNSSREQCWALEWLMPALFEFENWYVFRIDEIWTALELKIKKRILLDWYELHLDKEKRAEMQNVNLITYNSLNLFKDMEV